MASTPHVARAQVSISASIQINSPTDFYQPLEPYGTWVDVGSYGRCWRPRGIATDWQPYTQGHWEWTDAGWYWASDEPWGWACFHYGSWYQDSSYGWVWIPATDWAPAWVTWRSSDAYIGWAPCGPGLTVLAPSFFTFCDVHRFGDHFHSRGDLIVNNTTIINRTKVVKTFERQSVNFDGHSRTIYANRGPGVDSIQRATGKNFTPRPVRDVIRDTPHPDNVRRDNNPQRDQRPAEQRRETPTPTGGDQQRNYQQQPNHDQKPPVYQTPQQQNQIREQQQRVQPEQKTPQTDRRPEATPPTGRDQPRVYPEKPLTPIPTPQQPKEVPTPPQHPTERTLPSTGRDDVRPAQPEHRDITPPVRQPQEVPKPAPEQHKEVPVAPPHPAAPAERPLPPTGREDIHPQQPAHPAPPARVPDDGHAKDGRDKNNP